MKPATPAFLDAVTASHRAVITAQVVGHDDELRPIDGTVTLDARSAVRGSADVTFADPALVPTTASDLLTPYGAEIHLHRGIALPTGVETVPLGVYRIDRVTTEDTADGGMITRVSGLDRSARVIDARFEAPYQVAAGTNYATAILATIQAIWPDVPHDLTATGRTTPLLSAQEGADRWEFCRQMATSIGMVLYFDGNGALAMRPVSAVNLSPVWAFREGAGGSLVRAARDWNRQGAYNRVIATGENTGEGTPVRGVATDDNPLSPTYFYGPFGQVPRFYASEFITTTDQATDAAASILFSQLGTTQTVSFGALVNPAIEPDDVVQITRQRSGLDEVHIIDQLVIPLSVEQTMNGATRAIVSNA